MPPRTENGRKANFSFTGPLGEVGNSTLNFFGVKLGGPSEEKKTAERKKEAELALQPKRVSLKIQLWLGARLPFVAFTVILLFFTYVYHLVPILPWLAAFFSLSFAVIVCWPPKQVGTKHRDFWDWCLMWSWLLAIGFSVTLGVLNYGILESWVNTTFLREYQNVRPNVSPKAVVDAGILTFGEDTILKTEMSAGFKHLFYNYCAAPIVDHKDPKATPVTFWAVGIGCCESRGKFLCDSAADASARSGVPLRPHNLGPLRPYYDSAVRMAAAANDLAVSKDHVFVMWQKDPKKLGKWSWWFATINVLILILVALCSCCACQSGLTHISVMEKG